MGESTAIEWCDKTFNPWIGCAKVHTGCLNCYAETDFDKRRGVAGWGHNGTRVITSEANWKKPLAWNKEAAALGVPTKVFCASLADIFEDWPGNILSSHVEVDEPCAENGFQERRWRGVMWHRSDIGVCTAGENTVGHLRDERLATMDDLRLKLFRLIDSTPWINWLILTKRPQNIPKMWRKTFDPGLLEGSDRSTPLKRENVWLGTSVSDQATAEKFIPELRECRGLAGKLFVSAEPLVGPIDFNSRFWTGTGLQANKVIDWMIVGGESGFESRPFRLPWIEELVRFCGYQQIPCFVKQLGSNVQTGYGLSRRVSFVHKKGGDPTEWPEELRVRQFPCHYGERSFNQQKGALKHGSNHN